MRRLQRQFDKFHADNPQVYKLFCKFAREVLRQGYVAYSSRAIVHRIRWHTRVETTAYDGFKINNNHSPYYGRLWMKRHPMHPEFFKTRGYSEEHSALD